jgi:hypothetical protein
MKYVAIWFAAFFGISAVDALWHLGIFGWAYGPGFGRSLAWSTARWRFSYPWSHIWVLVVSALMV